MQYNNKSALATPLANKVVLLNKQLAFYGAQCPHGKKHKNADGTIRMSVDIKRGYLYPLLEKGNTLFVYALRQLKGKDYVKRSQELIEEIQAQCYLIMQMRGWNERTCAELDLLCDDIAKQIYAITAHNARAATPTGESGSV